MSDDTRLNDAILALEQAEGEIDTVTNPEKVAKAIEALDAIPKDHLRELIEEFNEYATGEAKNAQELAETETWGRAADKMEDLL